MKLTKLMPLLLIPVVTCGCNKRTATSSQGSITKSTTKVTYSSTSAISSISSSTSITKIENYYLNYVITTVITSGVSERYNLGDAYFGMTLEKICSHIKLVDADVTVNVGGGFGSGSYHGVVTSHVNETYHVKLDEPADLGGSEPEQEFDAREFSYAGNKYIVKESSNSYYRFSYYMLKE